jgi:6-phosphogluconolactonase
VTDGRHQTPDETPDETPDDLAADPALAAAASGWPRIITEPDAAAASRTAAAFIAETLATAVAVRGRADFATTGGSAPVGIYRALAAAPLRDAMPWEATHVWWGDDRFVPREHELSNVKPLDDVLLRDGAAPVPAPNLHPFPVARTLAAGEDEAWCAAELAGELRTAGLERRDGWPVFDLVLLGVGGDGHILSVFPGSAAFASDRWALAIPAPTHIEPHVPRVTLNPRVVTAARAVLVVALGESKAATVRQALRDAFDPERLPAQLTRRPGSTWVIDEAAAGELSR